MIKHVSHNSLTHFVYSYIFLILLSAPLIFCLFREDFSIDVIIIGENRYLANAPDFRKTKLNDLPKLWDQYFKDRTPFRQIFMPGYVYFYEKLLQDMAMRYLSTTWHRL